jgi:hypothetical protein
MNSRFAIALIAAFSVFAIPTVSHGENQSEWLQRQLQMTDGYAPPPAPAEQNADRAPASSVRRGALRVSHPVKPALSHRRVSQQPASAHELPGCQETQAVAERPPAQVECPECRMIEAKREADIHGEGLGLAALGVLLFLAGFKVMRSVPTFQTG